jgi:hypothetical protein
MHVTITIPDRAGAPILSIPYRRGTTVNCTIQWDEGEPHVPVQFSVEGSSPENGTAVIVGDAELTESETVRLFGQAQTGPGHAGLLRVTAVCNEHSWNSQLFSVCAHPVAVVNGPEALPHYSNDAGIRVGMYVTVGVVSDSGDTSDLDAVDDREQVSENRDQSALLAQMGGQPEIGEFEPAHRTRYDRHRHGVDQIRHLNENFLRGQSGEWSNDQLDIFVCRRYGMVQEHPAVVPNSGYRITRRIHSSPPNRLRFTVTKRVNGCTVEGQTTGPGPSDTYSVMLDVEQTAPNEFEQLALPDVMPVLHG